MFEIFKNKEIVCLCRFINNDLVIVLMDFKGNIINKFKCEDECVYSYFGGILL